jgi:ribosomal protein S3AE
MKTLNIQVENSLYEALLEILENLPKHKIKIQEVDSDNCLDFEQAMDYTLDKNKELYKRLS